MLSRLPKIEVPDPIRSIEVCVYHEIDHLGRVGVAVGMDSHHVETGQSASLKILHQYNRDIASDFEAFMASVREQLIDLVCHELDEWITVEGERIFDPHLERESPEMRERWRRAKERWKSG